MSENTERLRERAEEIVTKCGALPIDIKYMEFKLEIEQALIQTQRETAEECAEVAFNSECTCHDTCKWGCCGSKCWGHISNDIRTKYGLKE